MKNTMKTSTRMMKMEKTEMNAEDEVDEKDEEDGGDGNRLTMASHIWMRWCICKSKTATIRTTTRQRQEDGEECRR